MKTYPKYKDSGVEWIGDVPEGWEVKKIKHSTYVKGRVGWHGLNSSDFIDEGPFLVTGTDFSNGRIDWNTCYHVSMEHYDKDLFIQLKENDLLITKDGSIGKVAIVQGLERRATLNSGIFVTRPLNNKYLTTYLYWALNSSVFANFIDYNKTGSTVLHLYQDTFDNFSFPLPLINEQKSIVAYLDRKTIQIDNLISKKQKLIELLKEERAAIINQAVTKGLNPDASMKDSGIEWLPKIPKDWQTTSVKYITSSGNNAIVDGPFGSSVNVQTDYVNDGILVVRTVNITDNGFDPTNLKFMRKEKFEQLKRHAVYPKDVLLSKVGTIGNACLFPEYFKEGILSTTGSCKITVNIKMAIPKYIILLLQSMKDYLNFLASANVQSFLNMMTIKNMRIPLPKISEQLKIIEYVLFKTSKIDQTISKIKKQSELLKEFRAALISEVVTGKIDVSDEELE